MSKNSFWYRTATLLLLGGTLGLMPAAAQPTPRFEAVKVGAFSPAVDSLLTQALAILNQHFFSAEFKRKLLATPMKRTQGLTPAQVYERVTRPNLNGNVVMRLTVYTDKAGGEVGVTTTNASGTLTSTFEGYVTRNGAKCYAAHLAHEYCHWVGFTHPKYSLLGNTKARSVPYAVGDLLAEHLDASCP